MEVEIFTGSASRIRQSMNEFLEINTDILIHGVYTMGQYEHKIILLYSKEEV